MAKNIRVPRDKATQDEWARFWRQFGKIVRTQNGAALTGMKY
jgi:hypothetical protein